VSKIAETLGDTPRWKQKNLMVAQVCPQKTKMIFTIFAKNDVKFEKHSIKAY